MGAGNRQRQPPWPMWCRSQDMRQWIALWSTIIASPCSQSKPTAPLNTLHPEGLATKSRLGVRSEEHDRLPGSEDAPGGRRLHVDHDARPVGRQPSLA